MSQFIYILPLLIILAGAITMFLVGVYSKMEMEKQKNITIAFIVAALLVAIFNYGDFQAFYLWESKLSTTFVIDKFSILFNIVFLLGTLFTVILGGKYFSDKDTFNAEFFSLVLFALFGMQFLAHSNELITALVSLELASLSIYMLAGYKDKDEKSKESMMKYLVLGSITSGFFVMGMAFIYGALDTTFITDIFSFYQNGGENKLVNLGVILITITMLFKMGAVPFHAWVVEVYKGAPLPVTLFMAAIFKLAIFTIALRIVLIDTKIMGDTWVLIVQLMAILTLIGGTWLTITQNDLKKLLAGSGIVHSGYLLIAIAAIGLGSNIAPNAIVFYLISYFITSLGIFGVLTYLYSADRRETTFDGIKGLAKSRPYISFFTLIFVLSLSGVPLTIGFMGKIQIFFAGIDSSQYLLVGLAIISAFISFYYYFKIISSMYFYNGNEAKEVSPLGIGAVLLAIIAFFTIWGGVGVDLIPFIPGVDGLISIAKEAILSITQAM